MIAIFNLMIYYGTVGPLGMKSFAEVLVSFQRIKVNALISQRKKMSINLLLSKLIIVFHYYISVIAMS